MGSEGRGGWGWGGRFVRGQAGGWIPLFFVYKVVVSRPARALSAVWRLRKNTQGPVEKQKQTYFS